MTKASVVGRMSRATKLKVDPVRGESAGERFAIPVRRKARDESRRRAKPSQPDRDVVGRAAEDGVIGVRLDRIGDEIDQRLAGDQDHWLGFPRIALVGLHAIV